MTDGGGARARARARQEEGKSWRGDDGQPGGKWFLAVRSRAWARASQAGRRKRGSLGRVVR